MITLLPSRYVRDFKKEKKKRKVDCIVDVRMVCGRIKGACSWNEMLDDWAGLHRSGSEWRRRNEGGWWSCGGGRCRTGGSRTSLPTSAAAAASLEAVIG